MKKMLLLAAFALVAGMQLQADRRVVKHESCDIRDSRSECAKTVIEGRPCQQLKGETYPCKTYSKTVTFTCPEVKCADKTCPACPPCVCPVCPQVDCKAVLVETCPEGQCARPVVKKCGTCHKSPCGCRGRRSESVTYEAAPAAVTYEEADVVVDINEPVASKSSMKSTKASKSYSSKKTYNK